MRSLTAALQRPDADRCRLTRLPRLVSTAPVRRSSRSQRGSPGLCTSSTPPMTTTLSHLIEVLIVKLPTARDALLAQLQTVTPRRLHAQRVQALSGIQILRRGRRRRAARDRHGGRPARPARGARSSTRARRAAGPAAVDVVRALSGPTVSLELRAAEQDVELVAATRPSTSARCAPRTSRPSRSRRRRRRGACPARRSSRRSLKVARSASRDETRPVLTGILVSAAGSELRMVATDSYRLSVKETRLEPPLAGLLRGERAGARAAGAGAARAAGSTPRTLTVARAPEPGRLRGRRRGALLAADRRPVPQLPPAAARDATSTSCARPRPR